MELEGELGGVDRVRELASLLPFPDQAVEQREPLRVVLGDDVVDGAPAAGDLDRGGGTDRSIPTRRLRNAVCEREGDRGRLRPEQKQQMIERVTDAMVAVEGEAMRDLTTVVIDEVRSGDWRVGGRSMSTQDVLAHAAGS